VERIKHGYELASQMQCNWEYDLRIEEGRWKCSTKRCFRGVLWGALAEIGLDIIRYLQIFFAYYIFYSYHSMLLKFPVCSWQECGVRNSSPYIQGQPSPFLSAASSWFTILPNFLACCSRLMKVLQAIEAQGELWRSCRMMKYKSIGSYLRTPSED
jgi:hypothetical protein